MESAVLYVVICHAQRNINKPKEQSHLELCGVAIQPTHRDTKTLPSAVQNSLHPYLYHSALISQASGEVQAKGELVA